MSDTRLSTIETGIPPPRSKRGRHPDPRYEAMKPNQSVKFRDYNEAFSFYSCMHRYFKTRKQPFTSQMEKLADGSGWRVWKVKAG